MAALQPLLLAAGQAVIVTSGFASATPGLMLESISATITLALRKVDTVLSKSQRFAAMSILISNQL